jgi:hypothetical protein
MIELVFEGSKNAAAKDFGLFGDAVADLFVAVHRELLLQPVRQGHAAPSVDVRLDNA